MLEVDKINVSIGQKQILKNVYFRVGKGEVLGVLGKNGAGKTTLFNAIAGLLAYKGSICFNEKEIEPNQVAYLETENYFYPYMKGGEYLRFFTQGENELISRLTEIFAIEKDEYVHNYSTGSKKKIAIIANYALNKPLLILDEPFNGLDFESVEKLYLLIKRMKEENTSVLISSHVLETLTNCCDRIVSLDKGSIVQEYEKAEFSIMEKEVKEGIQTAFKI